MRRLVLGLACSLSISTTAVAQELVAPTEALPAAEQQKMFHLPPGFEIQLVAAEPDVHKPMNIRFDHQGRMYVTESLEYPFPAAADAPKRDYVHRYEDFAPDGKARKITKVVEGLNIPIGVLPTSAGLLYYSIPNLYRATDADGDGVTFERSEPFVKTFGFKDTHGMCSSLHRGLDGWIYATHGYANTSEVSGGDGQAITMNSGNTFRIRFDGSHVEQWTHGQVNPFGLCFDSYGNLYSADCHSMPVYMLLRGAYYPSFGKPHDGLGFGPEMIKHLHGSTGIAGVVYYAADQFPRAYRDTIFIGNPVTGKVNHDHLAPFGSTYECIEQPEFITCDDPWFRPVDIQLGPDGALYIADFYNCIIGHYEVPLTHPRRDRDKGRIWRVVYTGTGDGATPLAPLPDITALDAAALLKLLAGENIELRTMVTHELVDRIGPAAIEPVKQLMASPDATGYQRVHGLWVLERLGALDPAIVARLTNDLDPQVRVHLIKALAERSDWSVSGLDVAGFVVARLGDGNAFVRRAAADALARHPRPENVAPLLNLWAATAPQDTHLTHVVRMAARDQLLFPEAFAEARSLAAATPAYFGQLADVSLGVPNAEAAAFVLEFLKTSAEPPAQLDAMLHHAARYGDAAQLAAACEYAETLEGADQGKQLVALRALQRAAQARGEKLPEGVTVWAARLGDGLLASNDEGILRQGIDLARELSLVALFDRLATLADAGTVAAVRPPAIDACVAIDAPRSVAMLAGLLADAAEPIDLRQKAAQALGAINNDEARAALAAQLVLAPQRLAIEIASALAGNAPGAELLIAAVTAGKASAELLQEAAVVNRLRAANVPDLDARLTTLTAGLAAPDARIRELIEQRRAGFAAAQPNVEAGKAVFAKQCAICHRIGGEGAKIGPELDGIGVRGADRLLEDMLSPNSNVDQAFRSTLIATTDGRAISGLVLREEGEVLVLADAQGKEVRVPLAEIDERTLSPLSPMPGNVADLVPEPEFYNLLAYLLEQKQPAK